MYMKIDSISDNREFTAFPELQKMSDEELQTEYLKGDNIHISTSKASAAKRLLDIREQQKQTKAIVNIRKVTEQLDESNKELSVISDSLKYFKKNWLPKQPWWLRILSFILVTLIVAYMVNMFAAWTTYKLGW